MSELTIIEINGIKMEVDLRSAKKIENYKVGDNIKVLVKKYSETYESYYGVIVGFDEFEKLPTINVCYVESSYNSAEIKMLSINSKTEGHEICHIPEHENIFNETRVVDMLDNKIAKAQDEVDTLTRKKYYFLNFYNKTFKN
jgi:hypothetical protein